MRQTSKLLTGPRVALAALAISFAAPLALGTSAPVYASTIRVLVNDAPITSYDIQERTKMLRVFTGGRQGEKQAIDQLIEELLMLQEAKRRNVSVTDAEVEAEVNNRARSSKMTGTQFAQALRQAGIDSKTFREFLRANLAWQQVVRSRFRATIQVTDQDVTAALTGGAAEAAPGEEQTVFEYRLQQIVFIVPEGAGAGAEAKSRSDANAFRSAFQGCDQSLTQAAGTPGIVVKPQIRREEGQLGKELKEALAQMEVGSTTEPEKVNEGTQIVAVCAKNAIAGQTEATVEAREDISNERGQLLARRYLRDLRSDAVIEYR